MKCPKCGNEMGKYPALSRVDNKTEICSDCGVKEALEIFLKSNRDQQLKEDLETIIDLTKCGDELFHDGIELDIRSVAERALKRLSEGNRGI